MADPKPFYIPGMPENLQGVLYTPTFSQSEVKRLRAQNAGNREAQQALAVEDRYWQGREMAQDNPLAAVGSMIGSLPYDAAKLAYFHGPQPVKRGLERLTEKLFPGEAFNEKTTSRPAAAQYKALGDGITEGTYGFLRDKLEALNRMTPPEPLARAVRGFTEHANYTPTFANRLLGDNMPDINTAGMSPTEREGFLRRSLAQWGLKNVAANAADPIGTWKKAASTLLQTVNGDFDTRPAVGDWNDDTKLFLNSAAPGLKPLAPMSPAARAKQDAQISELMKGWAPVSEASKQQKWPIEQKVPLLNLGG